MHLGFRASTAVQKLDAMVPVSQTRNLCSLIFVFEEHRLCDFSRIENGILELAIASVEETCNHGAMGEHRAENDRQVKPVQRRFVVSSSIGEKFRLRR